MSTRTLYLVRHGQYRHDQEDPREGSLTALGRKQARRLARRLRDLPIDAIHCSTLARAEETARLLAGALKGVAIHPATILQECMPGLPSTGAEHIASSYLPEVLEQGRRQAEVAFRRFFRRTHGPDRHEIIVSHGNLIRYLVCRALGTPTERWASLDMRHAGLCELTIASNGHITIIAFNDTGHLPATMLSFV